MPLGGKVPIENELPEEMEAFFNTRADGYEAHMAEIPEASHWRDLLENQLPATPLPMKILDLGCGTGLEIGHILQKQPNAHITCIDLSESMLNKLRETYSAFLDQLEIVKASYFEHELGIEFYNLAIACVTMHHWLYSDKLKLYKRIHRSLKREGAFIISDYMAPEEIEKAKLSSYLRLLESGKIAKGKHYHIDIPFSVKTEANVLREAGFTSVRLIEESYSETFGAAMLVAEK
jgi:tRNA (cmo5U34)-methyltransferase